MENKYKTLVIFLLVFIIFAYTINTLNDNDRLEAKFIADKITGCYKLCEENEEFNQCFSKCETALRVDDNG